MQKFTTLTGTGQTEEIVLNQFDQLTFASIGDAADYTLTAEVKLTNDPNSNWFPAQIMDDNTLYSTITGAQKLRFNLSALGTATTIDIEVTGAQL